MFGMLQLVGDVRLYELRKKNNPQITQITQISLRREA